ncbi:DUF354 domain-containing protein [candidate division KSB1 bacterium]|nr:DUF354 domain-containing protein [candidate division KSB1 bacterium]
MNYLCYLGHPAHYHLFKHVITNLKHLGHEVRVLCKTKDILGQLLEREGVAHENILPEGRRDGKLGLMMGMLKRDVRLWQFVRQWRPDLMFGTSVEMAHVGRLLGIPYINVNEDDAAAVSLYAKLSYPGATAILSPVSCDNARWEKKSIKYAGYHELAYLHPDHFQPQSKIVDAYFPHDEPFFILRFARLAAHHDQGVKGITPEIARQLIRKLSGQGKVYITSERPLESEFEPWRLAIDPVHMHHILAFARLYIGDSQTMAAEAGVLGTPFIRFNDFVGRLGYLDELENTYRLGFGIRTSEVQTLYETVDRLLAKAETMDFAGRRQTMLDDKISVAEFMTWVFAHYPDSLEQLRQDPSIQYHISSLNAIGKNA